jgi:single-strand DNA-binding protein
MNNHTIHGRLARDPELTPRKNSDAKDRINFTVAVDRRFGDETDFFDCVLWGGGAAVIDKYFHKGSEILLSGEGQIRKYTGKDGVDRKAYSIVVNEFDFCGSKIKSEQPSDSWEEADADNPF